MRGVISGEKSQLCRSCYTIRYDTIDTIDADDQILNCKRTYRFIIIYLKRKAFLR